MKDLKPCPFCGKKLEMASHSKEVFLCITQGCYERGVYIRFDTDNDVNRWNTRPIEDAKDKEIDRLKRIIDPHLDEDGNFDKQGFDWKCLEWENEIERLKSLIHRGKDYVDEEWANAHQFGLPSFIKWLEDMRLEQTLKEGE